MNRFHLKACVKCHGDLVLDEGDWLCLQCGTYYYTGLYRKHVPTQLPQQPVEPPLLEKTLRFDHLAADSLVEQYVSACLAQLPELPMATKLNVSMRHQHAV